MQHIAEQKFRQMTTSERLSFAALMSRISRQHDGIEDPDNLCWNVFGWCKYVFHDGERDYFSLQDPRGRERFRSYSSFETNKAAERLIFGEIIEEEEA
jgi:hypothetical protein